jgi:hypothetical protein
VKPDSSKGNAMSERRHIITNIILTDISHII